MPALPSRCAPLLTVTLALLFGAADASGQQRPAAPPDTTPVTAAPARPDSTPVAATPTRPDSAAVVFRGDTLTWLYGSLGPFPVQERADAMGRRLADLRRGGADSADVRVVTGGERPEIRVDSVTLVAVTAADTLARGSAAAATEALAAATRVGLRGARITRNLRAYLVGLLETILATAAVWLLLRLIARWYPRLYDGVRDIPEEKLPSLRLQRLVLLSGERVRATLLNAVRLSRLLLTVILAFIYFPLVFSFFPPTRVLAQRIFALALEPTRLALAAVVGYLPNLFYIAVIAVLTYYGLRIVHVVFTALGQGVIRLPGFFPDWAEPSYKLLRILVIAFAVILIWPYLPNSNSTAFRGVAAFLGLLVTFGSAGAVSNVVGGVVMIYMRPFQIGDRVRISDAVGDVVQRGMLVTRIRTPKNVEITIPNSMVLGSHIVNYSTTARESGVILHTSVTIGYDTPWTQVHDLMKAAALRVEGILREPAPFVLQTALGDSAVSYELNAYTAEPGRMAILYSALHENLQDAFAEAGVEIMSPLYHAMRDGNRSTLPPQRAPAADSAPSVESPDTTA